MRKALFFLLIFGLFQFLYDSSAHAISLSFVPSSQSVVTGKPFDVAIVISDLVDNAAPSLGTFDLDVGFDPSILQFVVGSEVFGNQLDLFGLGSIRGVALGGGGINIFEVSLDPPDALNNQQIGSFTLATLTFNTLAEGTSPLSLSVNALGDADGNPLVVDVSDGLVTVTPEPSTFLFVGSGLVGLVVLKRKRLLA